LKIRATASNFQEFFQIAIIQSSFIQSLPDTVFIFLLRYDM
jgi:hypothetical protein